MADAGLASRRLELRKERSLVVELGCETATPTIDGEAIRLGLSQ